MSVVKAPQIDPRVEFWSKPQFWPRDATGVIFLGRIVHHLGGLMHGQEWTGAEPSSVVIYAIHRKLSAVTPQSDISYACNLLYERHLSYRQRADAVIAAGDSIPLPTDDEWAVAYAWSAQIEDSTRSALNRYSSVVRVLVRVSELGIVRSALRGYEAGHLMPVSNGDWFNECYFAWFATCQIDRAFPFNQPPVRYGGRWIYVDEESYFGWLALAFDTVGKQAKRAQASQPVAAESTSSNQDEPLHQPRSDAKGDAPARPHADASGEVDGEAPTPMTTSGMSAAQNERMTERYSPVAGVSAGPDGDVAVQVDIRGATKSRRKAGTRKQYNWEAYKTEVVRRVRSGNAAQAVHEFADLMAEWCSSTWGREPSNSRLRHYIDEALAENGLSLNGTNSANT